jgi:hypothetical protein
MEVEGPAEGGAVEGAAGERKALREREMLGDGR